MWVRTQNKWTLKKIEHVLIFQYKGSKDCPWIPIGYAVQTMLSDDNFLDLGIYSTEQQALQVLDEIQDRINEGCPFVYQMPEDDFIDNMTEKEMENLMVENKKLYEELLLKRLKEEI